MQVRRHRGLAPLVGALVLLGACVGIAGTGDEVRADVPRAPADPGAVGPTVAAVDALGADLYLNVVPGRGNVVISPWATATALGELRLGAREASRVQLTEALHADGVAFDDGMSTVAVELATRTGERRTEDRKGDVRILQATSWWLQRGTTFGQPWLDDLSRWYDTGVRVVDFTSDPDVARQSINRWADGETDGRIADLVPRGTVTPFTRLVAALAVEVQAPWAVPFDRTRTRSAPFTLADGTTRDVPTLALTAAEGLRYAESDTWQAVELPYLGDELSMVVILPVGRDLTAFEDAISGPGLRQVTDRLRPQPVDLRLPRFQFTTAANLNDTIGGLGLQTLFDPAAANLTGITTDEPLAISEFVFQGYAAVDEDGSGAAATTVQDGTAPTVAGARRVSVDRPFLFLVRDRSTGMLLLLGRVVDPTA